MKMLKIEFKGLLVVYNIYPGKKNCLFLFAEGMNYSFLVLFTDIFGEDSPKTKKKNQNDASPNIVTFIRN